MTDVSILGPAAVRGNPDEMTRVARFLRDTAGEIDDVRRTLERNALRESWTGAAAEAFRRYLESAPDDLDKAARSYDLASDTVSYYSSRLRTAHDTAQYLADQIGALQGQAGGLDGRVRTAQHSVDDARRQVSHATAPARPRLQQVLNQRLRDLSSLTGQRAGVQRQLDDLHRRADDNRRNLDSAADTARSQLHEASKAGIRNTPASWWERHAPPLVKVMLQTLTDAITLPWAVADYLRDPSAENLSKLLGHVSAALTVVTIALSVALAVGTGGAALALLPEIIAGLKFAQAGVTLAKFSVDATRKFALHDPKVSYLDLAFDGADVVSSGGSALKAEKAFKQNWSGALHSEKNSEAWKTWGAKVVVFGEGVPTSKVKLAEETTKYVRLVAPKDLVEGGIAGMVNEWGNDLLPVIGKTKDPTGNAQMVVHSSATILKHTIIIPTTLVTVKPMSLIGQEAR
jgi:uncharacterized protein YukE